MTVRWKNGKSEQFKANIPVVLRDYPVQRLRVNPKFVTPPPELAEKIKQDRAEIRSTVTKVTPEQYWSLPLLRPVPGRVNSVFGVRRVFNGVPKSAHRGVDFRGAAGTPIQTVESGVVALVSNHYYGGNTVIVDHGLGVFSVYLHMSSFNTQKGQRVKRGDIIGYIGSTGRSTGPHLHYSFYVMGESVNGATCLDLK
ncbi:M23 family metallopeptidase [Desulfovibrio sp. OttesenSCG-928-G15]|nr:M23 family metallopeptidase [Desulfovibrio sp. OttesenSCG-928-G15]